MDCKNFALQYFVTFSNQDIANLEKMFHPKVTLRDWDISATGIKEVVKANKKIFDSVDTIKVTPLSLYQQDTTVIAEIHILVDSTEQLLVTDIIDFNDDGQIINIRAYKG